MFVTLKKTKKSLIFNLLRRYEQMLSGLELKFCYVFNKVIKHIVTAVCKITYFSLKWKIAINNVSNAMVFLD